MDECVKVNLLAFPLPFEVGVVKHSGFKRNTGREREKLVTVHEMIYLCVCWVVCPPC